MYFAEEDIRCLVLGEVAVAQRWSECRWELFNELVLGNPQINGSADLGRVARALHTFAEDKLNSTRYFDVMDVMERV